VGNVGPDTVLIYARWRGVGDRDVDEGNRVPTRDRLAREVLAVITIRSGSKATRTRKDWTGITAGFRADAQSRSVLVGPTPPLASNATRLSELLSVFLDDHGVEGDSLAARLAAAADAQHLPEPLRLAFRGAASVDSLTSLQRESETLFSRPDAHEKAPAET